jgi:cobalt/nickel transport system permease protein
VFAASWLSVVVGAIACAVQIGLSSMFANAGGIAVTIPAMLSWHIIIGIGEGAITMSLLVALKRLNPSVIGGLLMFKAKKVQP